MAGSFVLGETKVRPGAYFNIQKSGAGTTAGAINGVTAVLFKSDFGPLGKAVEISSDENYESIFGTGLTTDAIREAVTGGAQTVIACRLGSGGTKANVVLLDEEGENALTVTAAYEGAKPFSVTVRATLSDATLKECIIFTDTMTFEKVEFPAGAGETKALADALNATKNFTATIATGKDAAILGAASQKAFTPGTNPTITNADYSNALAIVEAHDFNTLCVDTNDTTVHALVHSFVDRVFDTGLLVQAVLAESHTVSLDTRIAHGAAYNDEKIVYVLNAHLDEQGTELDGYQVAARVAGMIAAVSSADSLTHAVLGGISEILEPLTNGEIIRAIKNGCVALSYNEQKQVQIDSAVNTLVTPASNQDEGWKKIKRTKCRFELITRMNIVADSLIGKVNNDENGRATVITQLQGVGDSMVAEGKIVSCDVSENAAYPPEGDSAWFVIDVVDIDAMEHIYLTYTFRFSTSTTASQA